MNLALFDFDGTVTTRDTYTKFVLTHTSKIRLILGGVLLLPLIILNKLGGFPSYILRPIISRFAFIGVHENKLKIKAKHFVDDYLPRVIREDMLEKIKVHQRNGDRVILVSASLSPYLEIWCKRLNIELICSELEIRSGRYTGAYVNGDCSRHKKADLIVSKVKLSDFKHIIAYGDTREDYAMLKLADICFYRGKPSNMKSVKYNELI